MSFESKIIDKTSILNFNENTVVTWLYENRKLIETLTIDEIASAVHMSKSYISKVIKKLGYSSFAEFRVQLKIEADAQISEKNADVLELQTKDLAETKRLLRQINFTAIFDDFEQLEFIYCFGTGHTNQNYIRELSRNLMGIGNKRVIYLSGMSELESVIPLITKRDCFFIASHSGESVDLIKVIKLLKLREAKIISITSFSNNKLVRLANYNLFYYSTPIANPLKGTQIHSYLPLNLCIDTLMRNYLLYLKAYSCNETI
ncbi:MurR/RpiR family transcriptional regulator [Enterococcus sp. LJL120]